MASVEDLLVTAEQLPIPDLERFVLGVLALRSRRHNGLGSQEADLLNQINHPFPSELQEQYNTLIAKRDAETLTPEEHQLLLGLTDQMEQLEADWVGRLGKLAAIRRVDIDTLMNQLGLYTRNYV